MQAKVVGPEFPVFSAHNSQDIHSKRPCYSQFITGVCHNRCAPGTFVVSAPVNSHPIPYHHELYRGFSPVGICLIRLEQMRPAGFPRVLGFSSENAAHRIAVVWKDPAGVQREGVFIPRRDTNALINRLAGGRIFPGEHNPARFFVADTNGHVEFSMESLDGSVSVKV